MNILKCRYVVKLQLKFLTFNSSTDDDYFENVLLILTCFIFISCLLLYSLYCCIKACFAFCAKSDF